MKKFLVKLLVMAFVLITASSVALAKSNDELRAELNQMSVAVLDRMSKKYPETERAVQNAYAYCTISASSVKLGFWGDDHGRGVAVNNETGERIYVKMREVTIGLNIGAKEYDLLFIITNKDAWDSFTSGNIKFGTEVTATANDGVTGESYANATIIADGVWVYQLDKKGLALELTFKGARISPIRSLLKDNEKK